MAEYDECGDDTKQRMGIKRSAPAGIRTRVSASKGPNDWPLHYRSLEVAIIDLVKIVYVGSGPI